MRLPNKTGIIVLVSAIILLAGTLYGSIKRMLKAGLIHESDERPRGVTDQ